MDLIVQHMRPFVCALLLDQFGNYVVQGCFKFGPPKNDFVLEMFFANFTQIATNRFGARAIRSCLESSQASIEQVKLTAAILIVNAMSLAFDPHGILLLIWLVDECTYARRLTLLAQELIENIVSVCSSKIASLLVLKIVNQTKDQEARSILLDQIFGKGTNPQLLSSLEAIFKGPTVGPNTVMKILSSQNINNLVRLAYLDKVRDVVENRLHGAVNPKVRRQLTDLNIYFSANKPDRDAPRQEQLRPRSRTDRSRTGLIAETKRTDDIGFSQGYAGMHSVNMEYEPCFQSSSSSGNEAAMQLNAYEQFYRGSVGPPIIMQGQSPPLIVPSAQNKPLGVQRMRSSSQHNIDMTYLTPPSVQFSGYYSPVVVRPMTPAPTTKPFTKPSTAKSSHSAKIGCQRK